ncbi:unnamed protein product [Scytosiphon promiscuus]
MTSVESSSSYHRAASEDIDLSEATHRTLHGTQVVLKRMAVVIIYVLALVIGLVVVLLYAVIVLPPKRIRRRWQGAEKEDELLTNDWWGLNEGDDLAAREKRRPEQVDMRKGVELRTCYITTRDGVKLATDVWIPVEALEKKKTLPVVFHQARYYRSATLRWPFNLFINGGKPISFINDPFFKSFLSHGMILVSCDVRGTGASFGTHPGPWSPEEQQDSLEVLDWIDEQPWSNGRVALWGVSYEATSAFFTSLLRHPTVVCCCPMFFFWDVYDDISHPGGVPMKHFSVSWQGFNDSLDSGWVQSTGWMARIFLEGVTPVTSEDSWGFEANRAIAGHKDNWSILKDDHIRYMDDTSRHTGRMVKSACASQAVHRLLLRSEFKHDSASAPPSPTTSFVEVAHEDGENLADSANPSPDGEGEGETSPASGRLDEVLPFYLHVSGWLDASANASVMAFSTIPCRGSELLVGPWNHGGHQHVRPHHVTTRSKFDFRTEVSGFFVRHMALPSDNADSAAAAAAVEAAAATAEAAAAAAEAAAAAAAGISVGDEGSAPTANSTEADAGSRGAASAGGPAHAEEPNSGPSVPLLARADASAGADADVLADDTGAGASVTGDETDVVAAEGVGMSVLGESEESGALWTRSRPRVRYYTHQEERWHDAAEFPTTSSHKTDVFLSLGGKQKEEGQQQQRKHQGQQERPQEQASTAPSSSASPLPPPGDTADPVPSTPEPDLDPAVERGVRGVRGKISSRFARWPPFRKFRLTLSHNTRREEENKEEPEQTHELIVDTLKDHDGEGISRWAAMTEFLSLISYQMDGMRSNHLRFTSAPLKQDIEVTGYPVVSLWVSAADDIPNLDVFAYLQAVRPRTGLSIYVTEGCFRAEHRKEAERSKPVEVRTLQGVPIHSYLGTDAQPMKKGQPVEVRFKLMPTSFKFLKGQRVRLSIGGADARHFHAISTGPPGASPLTTAGDTGTAMSSGITPAGRGSAVAGGGGGGDASGDTAGVTKRVFRVHTGGSFASGVSLPVPHASGAGGGVHGRRGKGFGAGRPASTPRMGRGLWGVARSRSLSTPGSVSSLSNSTSSLLQADVEEKKARRRCSEGRLEDVLDLAGVRGSAGIFEAD